MTEIDVNPPGSAVFPVCARVSRSRAGPPGHVKSGTCSPNFMAPPILESGSTCERVVNHTSDDCAHDAQPHPDHQVRRRIQAMDQPVEPGQQQYRGRQRPETATPTASQKPQTLLP